MHPSLTSFSSLSPEPISFPTPAPPLFRSRTILTLRLHPVVGVTLVPGLEAKILVRGAEEHLTSEPEPRYSQHLT